MGRRTLLTIASILVAGVGVALIVLYVQGADQRAEQRVASVPVLTAVRDIPAGTSMAEAWSNGSIITRPATAEVARGAVGVRFNDPDSLFSHVVEAGAIIRQPMFGAPVPGAGHPEITQGQALTIDFAPEDRAMGILQAGDLVNLWGTTGKDIGVIASSVRVISIGTDTDPNVVAFDVNKKTATAIRTAQAVSPLRLSVLGASPTPTTASTAAPS